jgi:hypothetical protein
MQEKKWGVPRSPDVPNRNFDVWCVDRSVDEGRKAAMRWLIEFVGVVANDKGDPVPVRPHPNGKSVTIEQVGGRMFDTKSQGARNLAEIWQACTQASSHPTADTNHPPVAPQDLATALAIVIAHLENTLYKPDDRDFWKIVRDQEELAIARARSGQPTNAPGLGARTI